MPIRSQNLRIALVLVVFGLTLGGLELGLGLLHRHRTVKELTALRDRVTTARAAVEACRQKLDDAQRRFQRYDTLVDSLHQQVTSLERLDTRGVPETRYDEYLHNLQVYNDSVASWHLKSDSLKNREQECHELAGAHNVLADSLKRRLGAAGIPAP